MQNQFRHEYSYPVKVNKVLTLGPVNRSVNNLILEYSYFRQNSTSTLLILFLILKYQNSAEMI